MTSVFSRFVYAARHDSRELDYVDDMGARGQALKHDVAPRTFHAPLLRPQGDFITADPSGKPPLDLVRAFAAAPPTTPA